jgi:hypothetical protein
LRVLVLQRVERNATRSADFVGRRDARVTPERIKASFIPDATN